MSDGAPPQSGRRAGSGVSIIKAHYPEDQKPGSKGSQ